MTNLAAEARQRVQEKYPGAAVSGRGRNWIKHSHPGNPKKHILETHIGPIHYGEAEDLEIDTAWNPTGGGAWDWEMTTNAFQTYARNIFNAGNLFQFEKDGEFLLFDPQSINWVDENLSRQQIAIKQGVTAVVEDDVLMFPGAYGTGLDFSYNNQTARLQKVLTIDAFSRLPAPTVLGSVVNFETEFSMSLSSGLEFWIDGALWDRSTRVQTVNSIEVRDASGTNVLWYLRTPIAWDSSDPVQKITGSLEVRRQGGPDALFITIRIPYAFLETAVYPIYIDPTVEPIVAASADDSWSDENDGKALPSTGDTYMGTGGTGASYYRWTFWRWALNVPKGSTIDTALLYVWNAGTFVKGFQGTFRAEATDSAAAATLNEIMQTGRTMTSANVNYTLGAQVGAGAGFVIPGFSTGGYDLKALVQEVTDRSGWSSGNYLALNLIGNGVTDFSSANIDSYDVNTTHASKLYVEYTEGGNASPYYQRRRRV